MEIIRGLHNLRSKHRGCVATIGNFDGLHLGHQQVIKRLNEVASRHDLPSLLITFEPHPKEFFLGDKAPARLTRLREKYQVLKHTAIQRVLVIRFNQWFSTLPAVDFVRKILMDQLQVRHLLVGDDFRFGHQRQGDINLLKQFANQGHFQLDKMPSVISAGQRISSSLIRNALASDQLAQAQKWLGRPYSMCGRVIHGDKRGRLIGFPTANLDLRRQVSPLRGVYAVNVEGVVKGTLKGVANLGTRPTINGEKTLLEVHIFNFSEEIYGRFIQVNFLQKIRDEKKFPSFSNLQQQIQKDAKTALDYFERVNRD